jgi:hypothetical protein
MNELSIALRAEPRFLPFFGSSSRFASAVIAMLAAASCGTERPRAQIETPWIRAACVPVQAIPNILCATSIFAVGPFVAAAQGKETGSLAPLSVIFSPVLGFYAGISSAVDGVPCWELFHPVPGGG